MAKQKMSETPDRPKGVDPDQWPHMLQVALFAHKKLVERFPERNSDELCEIAFVCCSLGFEDGVKWVLQGMSGLEFAEQVRNGKDISRGFNPRPTEAGRKKGGGNE